MIKPPSGKKEFEIFSQNFSIDEVLKKSRKKCVLLKFSDGPNSAWMIVTNKKKIVAAYYHGDIDSHGVNALPEIQRLLRRNCKITAYELNEKILPLFKGMYPSVVVEKDATATVLGARIKDKISVSEKSEIKPEQFTQEWEKQEVPEKPPETTTQKEETSISSQDWEEEIEITAPVDVNDKLIDSIKNTLKESSKEVTLSESMNVANFYEFLTSLAESNFSGIVKGYDETIEMTAYIIKGEIIAATIKDDNVVVKGNSALLYFDTPAKVTVEPKLPNEISYPEDAVCEVDKDAKSSLYRAI